VVLNWICGIAYVMLQKPRLNMHRKKPFKKLVAELATVGVQRHGTEVMTNTLPNDTDDVLSCTLTDQIENGLKNTATDCNCNVAEPDGTSQT